ncbi:MAG: plastocyanin/azurin family copper-binding protein [Thermoleophilaceae bacterium]
MRRRLTAVLAGVAVAGAVAVVILVHSASAPASGLRTVTIRQGPFAVGAYQVRYTSRATKPVRAPQLDGYLVRMHARIVDGRGGSIPVRRLMLHHIVYKNLGRFRGDRKNYVCGGHAQSFYGTGEEDETLRFPPGYGYRVRKGDRWETGWMLMNHTRVTKRAYIEYTATIDTSSRLKPVTPYWLRASGCPRRGQWDPIFDVPGGGRRGSTYRRATTFRAPASGRLIAAGSHAHGGVKAMTLSQPGCGNRPLMRSRPLFGRKDHPYYHVLPVLHEPGPMDMSWLETRTGIPVAKGEPLRVTASYDDELPHTRVMGIMHTYLAPDRRIRHRSCALLPRDLRNERKHYAGRRVSPKVRVPLTTIDSRGRARTIDRPPGPLRQLAGSATVLVHDFRFAPRNLSVPLGARIRWSFRDPAMHNLTLANGPLGFSSQNRRRGSRFSRRLTRPGTYRFFCSLHPVAMSERIVVRRH